MRPLYFLKTYAAKQYARFYPSDLFIAVCGSLAKSACVDACRVVCSQKYKAISTKPNPDPYLSISQTILRLSPGVSKVILEMPLNQKSKMDFYFSPVRPKTVIFTKSDPGSYDKEGELIASLGDHGTAILNWDDPGTRKLAELCTGKVFFYGTDPDNCTVWAGNIKIEDYKTSFELNLGVERVKVYFKLLGKHQVYAALAAALLGVIYQIPLTKIKLALETLQPQEHKMELVAGPNSSILIDDTYDISPEGLESAIDTMLAMPARRRIILLGEIKDLGARSEQIHRQIAQKIYKEKLDLVFLSQGETQFIADELKSLGFWEEKVIPNLQNSQAVSKLLKTLGKGDLCLIKGSHNAKLDEVVRRIARKT